MLQANCENCGIGWSRHVTCLDQSRARKNMRKRERRKRLMEFHPKNISRSPIGKRFQPFNEQSLWATSYRLFVFIGIGGLRNFGDISVKLRRNSFTLLLHRGVGTRFFTWQRPEIALEDNQYYRLFHSEIDAPQSWYHCRSPWIERCLDGSRSSGPASLWKR